MSLKLPIPCQVKGTIRAWLDWNVQINSILKDTLSFSCVLQIRQSVSIGTFLAYTSGQMLIEKWTLMSLLVPFQLFFSEMIGTELRALWRGYVPLVHVAPTGQGTVGDGNAIWWTITRDRCAICLACHQWTLSVSSFQ